MVENKWIFLKSLSLIVGEVEEEAVSLMETEVKSETLQKIWYPAFMLGDQTQSLILLEQSFVRIIGKWQKH